MGWGTENFDFPPKIGQFKINLVNLNRVGNRQGENVQNLKKVTLLEKES